MAGKQALKTFEGQGQLPRLPVPKLQETLAVYLESVKCLLTEEEFAKTQALVKDFGKAGGDGEKLHKLLLEQAERVNKQPLGTPRGPADHPDGTPYPNTHWLEKWWEIYAYQSDRTSVAVNINCFQTHFRAQPCEKPLTRGAWAIKATLDAYRLLQEGSVPPEFAGKVLLCSAQYHRIFSTVRIPGEECDHLETYNTSRHICVERKGHWYVIHDVVDMSINELEDQLSKIVTDAERRPRGPGLAVLTTEDRGVWGKARKHLMSVSKQNEESLRLLETAITHFILSEEKPSSPDELHLIGQQGNGSQIWFDKSQSHILCDNGCFVSNLEHSSADAVVPARIYVYVDEYIQVNAPPGIGFPTSYPNPIKPGLAGIPVTRDSSVEHSPPRPLPPAPKPIEFELDEQTKQSIEKAKKNMDSLMDDNIVTCMDFPDFGAKTLSQKVKAISTDSFMQMSLALAYFRDQGEVPVPYETASTRGFLHGRTETIRPQSIHMKQFLEGFNDPSVSKATLADLIRKAADHHRNYLRRCMGGMGVDRHLMGLRILSAENGIPLHGMFADKGYQKSTRFTLSTSQMPWAVEDWPGFGAYDPIAYACCYRFTHVNTIVATVASRRHSGGNKDAKRFSEKIKTAMRDVFEVLSNNPPAAAQSKL